MREEHRLLFPHPLVLQLHHRTRQISQVEYLNVLLVLGLPSSSRVHLHFPYFSFCHQYTHRNFSFCPWCPWKDLTHQGFAFPNLILDNFSVRLPSWLWLLPRSKDLPFVFSVCVSCLCFLFCVFYLSRSSLFTHTGLLASSSDFLFVGMFCSWVWRGYHWILIVFVWSWLPPGIKPIILDQADLWRGQNPLYWNSGH